jgi:hypothetical protein
VLVDWGEAPSSPATSLIRRRWAIRTDPAATGARGARCSRAVGENENSHRATRRLSQSTRENSFARSALTCPTGAMGLRRGVSLLDRLAFGACCAKALAPHCEVCRVHESIAARAASAVASQLTDEFTLVIGQHGLPFKIYAVLGGRRQFPGVRGGRRHLHDQLPPRLTGERRPDWPA